MRSVWVAASVVLVACSPAPLDRCASKPCEGLLNSVCEQSRAAAYCRCPDSLIEEEGACVSPSACAPNPCAELHRKHCLVVANQPQCECDDGFVLQPDGCQEVEGWSCGGAHSDGDAAEPDECPSLASALAPGVTATRTLVPAGDQDWLRFSVQARHVYAVRVTATEPVALEVYDASPTRMLAQARRFSTSEVRVSPRSDAALIRVRALGAQLGSYDLQFEDLGLDDFPEQAVFSAALVPELTGSCDYVGDVDSVALVYSAGQAVVAGVLALDPSNTATLSQGGRAVQLISGTDVTASFRSEATVILRVECASVGAWSFRFVRRGPDDASDEPAFAEVLLANVVQDVQLDANEFDSYRLSQRERHVYAVRDGLTVPWRVLRGTEVLSDIVVSTPWRAAFDGEALMRFGPVSTPRSFSFSVDDLGLDDGDTTATATLLALNQTHAGVLVPVPELDVFRLEVVQGHQYRVSLAPAVLSFTLLDSFEMPLLTANGTLDFRASRTGSQWVRVTGATAQAYSISVTELASDDHSDAPNGATPLQGTASGQLAFDDVDFFSFDAEAGRIYQLAVSAIPSALFFSVTVRNESGSIHLASAGVTQPVTFRAPANERLFLEVEQSQSQVISYSLSLTSLGFDDFADTVQTASLVDAGAIVTGRMDFDLDRDAFLVETIPGHGYALRASTLTELSVDGFLTPGDSFLATTNGPVGVSVGAVLSVGSAWTVTLDDLGADEFGDDLLNATLVPQMPISGSLQHAGDVDVIAFDALPAHFYRATVSPSANVHLEVFDEQWQLTPLPVLRASGRIFMRASALLALRYAIQCVDLGADDHEDTLTAATVLPLDGGWVTGSIVVPEDRDVFAVPATSGQIVQLRLEKLGGNGVLEERVTPPLATPVVVPETQQSLSGFRVGTGLTEVWVSANDGASYRLSAVAVTDDFSDTAPTPISSLPITGSIDCDGDRDRFSFAATLGQNISVVLNSTGPATLDVIAPGNVYLPTTFVAPSTGTYQLVVSGSGGNAVVPYTLTVTGP